MAPSTQASLPSGLNSYDTPTSSSHGITIQHPETHDIHQNKEDHQHRNSNSNNQSTGTHSSSQHGIKDVAVAVVNPKTYYQQIRYFLLDRDYHLYLFTAAFVFLFFAYPIQGVQTIRYPATGSFILLVLYGAYGITAWFAAPFIDYITPEYAMPFGALTYGIWIATYYAGWDWLNLLGAAAFGWGAGLMWPAAGQLLATISTPHNRGSNNGIFQFGFHLGVFCGGLTLGGVTKAWPHEPGNQYAVFLGLCATSFIIFILHAISFRLVYRKKKDIATTPHTSYVAGTQPLQGIESAHHIETTDRQNSTGQTLYRVVHDDGTVEFREAVDHRLVHDENVVVADLALSGGRTAGESKVWSWGEFFRRCWQCIEMLWNPLFFPLVGPIFMTGGVSQGWWNASWNIVVNHAGDEWNGWIYAIAESMGMVSAVIIGLFYDRLRKHYQPHKYRWVMYYNFFATYCMAATALGASYLAEIPLGDGPGQLPAAQYYGIMIVVSFFFISSWLALEISVYTYFTTFWTYNADVAFSTKVFCEAMGYMVSYGASDVASPRTVTYVLFAVNTPSLLLYCWLWHAPDRPVALLLNEQKRAELETSKSGLEQAGVPLDEWGNQKSLSPSPSADKRDAYIDADGKKVAYNGTPNPKEI